LLEEAEPAGSVVARGGVGLAVVVPAGEPKSLVNKNTN